MPIHRLRKVRELFDAVVQLSPRERRHYLQQQVSDLDVSEQVARLLSEDTVIDESYLSELTPDDLALSDPNAITTSLPIADREPGDELPQIPGYETSARLGHGGMGVVYLACDTRLGRQVALKLLPAEFALHPHRLERFRREAHTASSLNHPGICTIYDVGTHNSQPYMVMELVAGQTLRELVREQLPWERLAILIEQVARALLAAHQAGVVHRDIKPENLMVRRDGYVKVLDFGLARRITASSAAESGTVPGAVIGTPHYMSPEQSRGEKPDAASDVFSLGVVLYELLTGRRPFGGETVVEVLHAINSSPVVSAARLRPEIPLALDALLHQMLHKSAELRPTAADVAALLSELKSRPAQPTAANEHAKRQPVGRRLELDALRAALESAAGGRGLVACITGEPGIGKTTLAQEFLSELTADGRGCAIGHGTCSERLAGTEAYLPILEALESLIRGPYGDYAGRLLKTVAPTWHRQLAPTDDAHTAANQATSSDRLKREFASFLEELSRVQLVVLFLDDLHWADLSTIDLLSFLGTRSAALRLLLVVTYRPTEMALCKHPFLQAKLELQAKGSCREVALGSLSRSEVEEFVVGELPGRLPANFVSLIFSKTEGNPLFTADLLRYLRDRGFIEKVADGWKLSRPWASFQAELPESVRSMIKKKLAQLDRDDRRLLSAASVQGHEFDLAVASRLLGLDIVDAEERLSHLEEVHALVRPLREHVLPDGTHSVRFTFIHVLYQNALYDDLPNLRKAKWSAQTAKALLAHFGNQQAQVAAQLALLFEAARDAASAAEHFLVAAQNASSVFAYEEAAALANRGLVQLRQLPQSLDRDRREFQLQLVLGGAWQPTRGFGNEETGQAYRRAIELATQLGPGVDPFPAMWGLWFFHMVRLDLVIARKLAEGLLEQSQASEDPLQQMHACRALEMTVGHQGEFRLALDYFGKVAPKLDDALPLGTEFGPEPGTPCLSYAGWALWPLGYPDQALGYSQQAIARARQSGHPQSLSTALYFATIIHQCRGEVALAHTTVEEMIALGEIDFPAWAAWARVFRGWVQWKQGSRETGISQMREALAGLRAIGTGTGKLRCISLLVPALAEAGQFAEAQVLLEEGLETLHHTGEYAFAADLYRTQGELLASRGDPQAEGWYLCAIETARGQQAKSLELRSITGLSRLLQQQNRLVEARQLLSECYSWFTEGLETADLRVASTLLQELDS